MLVPVPDEEFGAVIGALIVVGIVVAIVVFIIAVIINIGLIMLASVAAVGAVRGLYVAAKNFVEVFQEAHDRVPL